MLNKSTKKQDSFSNDLIILFIFFTIIFFKSVKDFLEIFSYGIFKKEILTEQSSLGFDIKIKMK